MGTGNHAVPLPSIPFLVPQFITSVFFWLEFCFVLVLVVFRSLGAGGREQVWNLQKNVFEYEFRAILLSNESSILVRKHPSGSVQLLGYSTGLPLLLQLLD